jgi:hypothetical protein
MNLGAWGIIPFVRSCEDGRIYLTLSTATAEHITNVFMEASELSGCHDVVRTLLKDHRIDPITAFKRGLATATAWGREETVEVFLSEPLVTSTIDEKMSVHGAEFIRARDAEINRARAAAVSTAVGPAVCVGMRMFNLVMADPRADPGANNNIAITMAVTRGKYEIAQILLRDSRVTPKQSDLKEALRIEQTDTASLLLADERIDPLEDIVTALNLVKQPGMMESLMRRPYVAHKVGKWFNPLRLAAPAYYADMRSAAWLARRHILAARC